MASIQILDELQEAVGVLEMIHVKKGQVILAARMRTKRSTRCGPIRWISPFWTSSSSTTTGWRSSMTPKEPVPSSRSSCSPATPLA